MARIQDIADKLNVTKSTVSKAMNGADDISEAMRKKVLETAIELGYTKKRGKDTQKKKLVILIRQMTYKKPSEFGYYLVLGFRQMAEQADFQVDIREVSEEMMKASSYDVYMLEHNYLGSFVVGFSLNDKWISEFKTSSIPAVLYDNETKGNLKATYIGVDSVEGMDFAIAHLKELGHTKIAYMGGLLGSFYAKERYRAFKSALKKHKLHQDKELYGEAYYISECVMLHLERILNLGATAIICGHDLLAQAVIAQCREMGKRVPEKISCIGFDDLPMSEKMQPPLTTIRQDRAELGKSAFYALTSLLNEVPIGTLLLHAKLMVRESTGPVYKG